MNETIAPELEAPVDESAVQQGSGGFAPDFEDLLILVKLEEQLFALPACFGHSMILMPETTAVPGCPSGMRGVIRFRGKVIPLVDLRHSLGMVTHNEIDSELKDLLDARIQDHQNWLNELEASVREDRTFQGALDPTQCKLGRWLETVETSDLTLSAHFQRIRLAHAALHAVAHQVENAKRSEGSEAAMQLVQRTRQVSLEEIITLFQELKKLYGTTRREIAVILEVKGKLVAFAVDSVVAVERLKEQNLVGQDGESDEDSGLIRGIGKRRKDDSLVQLLGIEKMIPKGHWGN